MPIPGDTIDDRQRDITHTFLSVASDNWKLSQQPQFSFSGFYRNYALQLRSNFGDGLIQQSETRNVFGGEAMYIQSLRSLLAVMGGVDLRRDGPRNLDLKRIDNAGVFEPVTSNNLTLSFVEPFVSLDGTAGRYLHFNLGVRQEEVWMNNQDLMTPQNSFDRRAALTLPKATLTLLPPDRWYLPIVSFSYGEAFHTNDPRIGTGTGVPALLAPSRAYQLVVSTTWKQTQFYVTLRRVSNSLELAKIDPDTGLQQAVGPSLNKVIAVSAQRNFSRGSFSFPTPKPMRATFGPACPSRKRHARSSTWWRPITNCRGIYAFAASTNSSKPNRWATASLVFPSTRFAAPCCGPSAKTGCRSGPTSSSPTATPDRPPRPSPCPTKRRLSSASWACPSSPMSASALLTTSSNSALRFTIF